MRVTKHHGLGNDFLVFLGEVPLFGAAELAQRLCDRRFGIGADGLIFGAASQIADVRFVLFNADGSQAEMSGNGIRCLAQAVVDATPGMIESNEVITLAIETVDGVRTLDVSAGRHGDAQKLSRGVWHRHELHWPGWIFSGADRPGGAAPSR